MASGFPLNPSPRSASLSRPLPQGEREWATAALATVSDTPDLDARILWDHAQGDPATFTALIARRLAHEPVAYITGTKSFWTIDLDVSPAVLIPRPDSETLIEAALAHFGAAGPRRVLDLGTGSGALLLAALDQWPDATGVGIDASPAALEIARANAARIAPGRAAMIEGDWSGTGEAFDLVLCNPPYIAADETLMADVADWEPASALFAGTDGLDDYRLIAPVLARQIAPGGVACIEIGHRQRDAVTALIEQEGLSVTCRPDLAGRDRCLIVRAK
jgi:release factor glutamine methyltransferase